MPTSHSTCSSTPVPSKVLGVKPVIAWACRHHLYNVHSRRVAAKAQDGPRSLPSLRSQLPKKNDRTQDKKQQLNKERYMNSVTIGDTVIVHKDRFAYVSHPSITILSNANGARLSIIPDAGHPDTPALSNAAVPEHRPQHDPG